MRKIIKRFIEVFIRPWIIVYLQKDRWYTYQNIQVLVKKGVFHPGLFFSTKLLIDFLQKQPLHHQHFLELGAGTGLLSIFAAKQGAKVTASDINLQAIENIEYNAHHNQVQLNTVLSDLFDNFPKIQFDYIFINPPYYPKSPQNEAEHAWFCGANFEYFQRLFEQISDFTHPKTQIFMILSEDCEVEKIRQIATSHHMRMEIEQQKRVWGEFNFIFSITKL